MGVVTAGVVLGAAAIGAVGSVATGAIASNRAKKTAKRQEKAANRIGDQIKLLEEERKREVPVIAPYSGAADLSDMITDLSDSLTNPFESIGVATQAAEIQMQQTDQALANTLDLLAATGASAGGATALARAAAQSKQGVAASLEKQEASNERLRVSGEANLQRAKMAEAQRVQSGLVGEAVRQQELDAADIKYEFAMKDARYGEQLDRKQAQLTGKESQAAASRQAGRDAMAAGVQGAIGSISGGITSAAGLPSTSSGGGSPDPGTGGGGGTGGSAGRGMFSDRKLKKNIKLIGKSKQGINIYIFEYINKIFGDGIFQGAMADEVNPNAVIEHPNGYKMIDYSMIDVKFKKLN
jgi:hypothetical protein